MKPTRASLVILCGILAGLGPGFRSAHAGDLPSVKVATEGTYKPFSYYDSGGNLTGFDVELIQAVCKAGGLNCLVSTMDYEGMIPALNAKQIDVIAAGFAVTEKRKKVVAFTDRIRSAGKQFVTCAPEKFSDVTPAGLKGHIIGTQSGTTNADYFKANYGNSDIRLYKSMDEAFQDLSAGRLDLVLSQVGPAYQFVTSDPGKTCKFVGPRLEDVKIFGDGVAFAVRQSDQQLLAALNAGIAKVRADGTYQTLNAKYVPVSLY